jgi:protein-S-isoprenylcysteine O-methyltransferase Ste14
MTIAHLNGICWGIFIIVWILGAVYNFFKAPTVTQRRFPYDGFIAAVLVWVIMRYTPHRYWTFITFHVPWLQVVGTALLIVSTLYIVWARLVIGKMWASHAVVKEGHKLVTTGPYRITRHPIYSGLFGMILGSALSLGHGLIFLGFVFALLIFMNRIRIEEQLMISTFGDQYVQYKKRVPQLIPGLKFNTKKD